MDEVLSVGDAEFQRRCLGRMEELAQHRPDGGLRLPRAAGRRPALRPRDLDRRRPAGRRRAGRRGDRQLPAPDPRGGHRAHMARGVGARGTTSRRSARSGRSATRECRRVSWTCAGRSASRSSSTCYARESRSSRRSRCSTRRARSPSTRWTPTSAGFSRPSPATYVATAWIPGNLLNEGSAIVEAAICSIDFPKLEHHAAVYEAVSFEVLDPGEGDSARGQFSGQWRGVVRPLLDWTCERV